MKRKVIRTGNSLAVTIPSGFVKKAEIRAGDEISYKIDWQKFKLIYLVTDKPRQLSLSDLEKKDSK